MAKQQENASGEDGGDQEQPKAPAAKPAPKKKVDAREFVQEVDILKLLDKVSNNTRPWRLSYRYDGQESKNWCDKVMNAKKWQEKRDLLQLLLKHASIPRIANGTNAL